MNNSPSSINQELIIDGASCASCVSKIEKALNNIAGVEKAEMNFALRTVSVTGDVKQDLLIARLKVLVITLKVPMKQVMKSYLMKKK